MPTKLVTLDEVLAESSSIIKDASDQEKVFMRQWIYRAQREIGFSNFDIKVSAPITLTDYSAAKPADFVKGIDVALFTSDGSEIAIKYKGWGKNAVGPPTGDARIHEDLRVLVKQITVSEDIDYYHTEPFDEGTANTAYMVLKYYSLPLDGGVPAMPLIPDTNVVAIMMYIKWMWALRQNRSLGEINLAREAWLRERARAEAKHRTPSVLEGKEIAKKINSMIQKPVLTYKQY
jgi:hypothetical protein